MENQEEQLRNIEEHLSELSEAHNVKEIFLRLNLRVWSYINANQSEDTRLLLSNRLTDQQLPDVLVYVMSLECPGRLLLFNSSNRGSWLFILSQH